MNKRMNGSEGNIERTVTTVIDLMQRLNALIALENDALRKMDRQQFLDLQMEKVTLAKSYEVEAQKLKALRGNLGKVDNLMREELKGTYREFSDHTDENLKVLKQRGDGVKTLNARIVDAARKILINKDEKYDAFGQVGKLRSSQAVSSGLTDTA